MPECQQDLGQIEPTIILVTPIGENSINVDRCDPAAQPCDPVAQCPPDLGGHPPCAPDLLGVCDPNYFCVPQTEGFPPDPFPPDPFPPAF